MQPDDNKYDIKACLADIEQSIFEIYYAHHSSSPLTGKFKV
jgi:hypothetical protein